MTKIYCFTDNWNEGCVMQRFLEELDEDNYEIQLFIEIAADTVDLELLAVTMNAPEQEEPVICMSDSLSLINAVFSQFPYAADAFLYFRTNTSCITPLRSANTQPLPPVPFLTNASDMDFYEKEPVLPLEALPYITKYQEAFYEAYRHLYNISLISPEQFTGALLNETGNILDELAILVKENLTISRLTEIFLETRISAKCNYICKLLFISFKLHLYQLPGDYNALLHYAMHEKPLMPLNRYQLWFQLRHMPLVYPGITSDAPPHMLYKLYDQIYQEYAPSYSNFFVRIPNEERNKDLVFVFTTTFLHERHAPTRTVLERCYTLGKLMNKKVILINTAEYATSQGMLPQYSAYIGNVRNEFTTMSTYTYKDYTFPIFQPDKKMPDSDTIIAIINMLIKHKPYFILSIGAASLTADICSNIVPVLSMSVTFSTFPVSISPLWILGRPLNASDKAALAEINYSERNIIESRFTFDLIPKHSTLCRKDFGIPEHCFLLAVVGLRLTVEVTDSFIQELYGLFEEGIHIVFAGNFDTYEDYCEKYPLFAAHTTFIGYCDDILALMEICDLYLNPPRIGGGFSIIEAFICGVPGVTLDQGDVAISAGGEFCVQNEKEMYNTILRYKNDSEFYHEMSEKARKRAALMTDSVSAMTDLLNAAITNPHFF